MIIEKTNDSDNRDSRHKRDSNLILKIRNVLNIIFMLTAIVGVIVYISSNKETGMFIVLTAIPFKITESAIRLLRI